MLLVTIFDPFMSSKFIVSFKNKSTPSLEATYSERLGASPLRLSQNKQEINQYIHSMCYQLSHQSKSTAIPCSPHQPSHQSKSTPISCVPLTANPLINQTVHPFYVCPPPLPFSWRTATKLCYFSRRVNTPPLRKARKKQCFTLFPYPPTPCSTSPHSTPTLNAPAFQFYSV